MKNILNSTLLDDVIVHNPNQIRKFREMTENLENILANSYQNAKKQISLLADGEEFSQTQTQNIQTQKYRSQIQFEQQQQSSQSSYHLIKPNYTNIRKKLNSSENKSNQDQEIRQYNFGKSYQIRKDNKNQFKFNEFGSQQNSSLSGNGIFCPICSNFMGTVQGFCRHIIQYHNVKEFDSHFYCPYCEFHTSNIRRFSEIHLLRDHSEYDQAGKIRFYFCPFQRIRFTQSEHSQLQHFIRTNTKYTKIDEQIEFLKLRKNNNDFEYRSKDVVLREKQKKQKPFIRGRTEIKFTQFGLLCPVCDADGFDKLKLLATHIKNIHRVRYPNNFFCPHCNIEFPKSYPLAEHLIRSHYQENDFSRYYQIQGCEEKFKMAKELGKATQDYMAYHTFFNPAGPGQMKEEGKLNIDPDIQRKIEE